MFELRVPLGHSLHALANKSLEAIDLAYLKHRLFAKAFLFEEQEKLLEYVDSVKTPPRLLLSKDGWTYR